MAGRRFDKIAHGVVLVVGLTAVAALFAWGVVDLARDPWHRGDLGSGWECGLVTPSVCVRDVPPSFERRSPPDKTRTGG